MKPKFITFEYSKGNLNTIIFPAHFNHDDFAQTIGHKPVSAGEVAFTDPDNRGVVTAVPVGRSSSLGLEPSKDDEFRLNQLLRLGNFSESVY